LAKLLFICSKNQWRSPTAEALFKNHPEHQVRSAGTSDKARIKVNGKLLDWADHIFMMERKHQQLLWLRFADHINHKQVVILNIEDNYIYNDPELIEILKSYLQKYL